MRKINVEITELDSDPSIGHTMALSPVDFPGQGIYHWGSDLYFVNDSFVNVQMLDDPHWLELFCLAGDSSSSTPSKGMSENFILKLIAVTQNPELAESLTLEK